MQIIGEIDIYVRLTKFVYYYLSTCVVPMSQSAITLIFNLRFLYELLIEIKKVEVPQSVIDLIPTNICYKWLPIQKVLERYIVPSLIFEV